MIEIDHMGIAARNAKTSAQALADILGAPQPIPEGADDDMYRVDLGHGASLLFVTSETVGSEHVAFRVDPDRFAEVVTRLRERRVEFGNDHDDTRNGVTSDPLGGAGRVYFLDENRHLFEVMCPGPGGAGRLQR
jgi:catechol 2,3-dioxygenase-like lactoylglutathione lyase family enzyme